MRYKVILFDADDTLFDYGKAEAEALRQTFEAFGLPEGAAEYGASYREINKALWRELELGTITSASLRLERFRRLFETNGLALDPEAFSAAYLAGLGRGSFLIEGAETLCGSLTGCRLAVITNGIKDVQTARIAGSPLCYTFERVIISEVAGCQKPERGIFDYAFAELGLSDKREVLMVGDSLTSDIAGGANYGIDTCWFNPHGRPNDTEVAPTYEIRHLSELTGIIQSGVIQAG